MPRVVKSLAVGLVALVGFSVLVVTGQTILILVCRVCGF